MILKNKSKDKIVFTWDELPSPKIQNQYDPLMIMVIIHDSFIRWTLVDNGSSLSVCGLDLLDKINVDRSLFEPSSITIWGFYNVAKQCLGVITFPVRVGPIVLPTPTHVMQGNLTYNLLLGIPWIHSMQVVPSTLHRQVKFIYNNMAYTLLVWKPQ